ncbi:MAG: protein-tyrosine phosphatase family protein [Alphaproteobacteria bacterium]
MTLINCGLAELANVIAARRPSHLVSLLDPSSMITTPLGITRDRHLRLEVNDVSAPTEGRVPPTEELILKLLSFGRSWDETAPMLVHCWAGISRSTAAAFVIACDKSPRADELTIALAMRRAAPYAAPNRGMVILADDLMGRGGRMVDAIDAMEDYSFIGAGLPFDFAARH